MIYIPLTQGKIAVIDDVDLHRVIKHKWSLAVRKDATSVGESVRFYVRTKSIEGSPYLHQFIINSKPGMKVDHKNHDGLDNRRDNLRECSTSQNGANQRKTRGSSIYKGVSWHKQLSKWDCRIKSDGVSVYIGVFYSEEDAARAYDRKARELFGCFALTNFKEDGDVAG